MNRASVRRFLGVTNTLGQPLGKESVSCMEPSGEVYEEKLKVLPRFPEYIEPEKEKEAN
jgi:hypothetical protein